MVHGVPMFLPKSHPLPELLAGQEPFREHLLRAAAIVFLAGNNLTYVDVGANVGDTAALVRTETGPRPMRLIEPSPYFFEFLQQNVKGWFDVVLIKKFVSIHYPAEDIQGALAHWGGTATLVASADSCISAAEQLDLLTLLSEDVGLVKLDCDGVDLQILLTWLPRIRESRPPILFECSLSGHADYQLLVEVLKSFEVAGYCGITICHHSGALLFSGQLCEQVYDVFSWQMNMHLQSHGEVCFYTDVLVVHSRDKIGTSEVEGLLREWQRHDSCSDHQSSL